MASFGEQRRQLQAALVSAGLAPSAAAQIANILGNSAQAMRHAGPMEIDTTPAGLRQVTAENLHPARGYGLWFSRIVLQHNPPPVMLAILRAAFRRLAPGISLLVGCGTARACRQRGIEGSGILGVNGKREQTGHQGKGKR